MFAIDFMKIVEVIVSVIKKLGSPTDATFRSCGTSGFRRGGSIVLPRARLVVTLYYRCRTREGDRDCRVLLLNDIQASSV